MPPTSDLRTQVEKKSTSTSCFIRACDSRVASPSVRAAWYKGTSVLLVVKVVPCLSVPRQVGEGGGLQRAGVLVWLQRD